MKNTGKGNIDMNHDHLLVPSGLECAKCIHFLANENSAAMEKVQNWYLLPSQKSRFCFCSMMLKGGLRQRLPFCSKDVQKIIWMQNAGLWWTGTRLNIRKRLNS